MKRAMLLALVMAGGSAWPVLSHAEEPICEVADEQWMDEGKVQEIATQQGWIVNRIEKAAGCWRVSGTDGWGMKFSAYVDPATGTVAKMVY